jgi:hypothetical protein
MTVAILIQTHVSRCRWIVKRVVKNRYAGVEPHPAEIIFAFHRAAMTIKLVTNTRTLSSSKKSYGMSPNTATTNATVESSNGILVFRVIGRATWVPSCGAGACLVKAPDGGKNDFERKPRVLLRDSPRPCLRRDPNPLEVGKPRFPTLGSAHQPSSGPRHYPSAQQAAFPRKTRAQSILQARPNESTGVGVRVVFTTKNSLPTSL